MNVDELIWSIYRKEQSRSLWGNSHLRGREGAESCQAKTVREQSRKGVSKMELPGSNVAKNTYSFG